MQVFGEIFSAYRTFTFVFTFVMGLNACGGGGMKNCYEFYLKEKKKK